MPASSLIGMAQRACIRNLPNINDVAEIPYELLLPILKKIDNPQKLHELEVNSPHLADHDRELWMAFIDRDIPSWGDEIVQPKNPRSWWKVYRMLVRKEQRAKEAQEKALREAMAGMSKGKEANQTKFVGKVIPQQSKSRAFVDGVPNAAANASGQVRTPALQNARRARDIMASIRKQSSEAHKERNLNVKRSTFGQPARVMLPSAKAQIKQAPESMLMDYSKPLPTPTVSARASSPPGRPTPTVFAPRRGPTAQEMALNSALRAQNAEREKRLKALTNPSAKPTTTVPAARRNAIRVASPPSAVSPPPPKAASPVSGTVNVLQLAVSPMPGSKRSPSPLPQAARKRPAPATSVFMPAKRKRI